MEKEKEQYAKILSQDKEIFLNTKVVIFGRTDYLHENESLNRILSLKQNF
jgi:hypothetical protein